MELAGLNLINFEQNTPLNPLIRSSIIVSYNLLMDPIMWRDIFYPFWNQWKPGYSPQFIYRNNRVTTIAINTSSLRSREEELESSIRRIIEIEHPSKSKINLLPLMNQIILNMS